MLLGSILSNRLQRNNQPGRIVYKRWGGFWAESQTFYMFLLRFDVGKDTLPVMDFRRGHLENLEITSP